MSLELWYEVKHFLHHPEILVKIKQHHIQRLNLWLDYILFNYRPPFQRLKHLNTTLLWCSNFRWNPGFYKYN